MPDISETGTDPSFVRFSELSPQWANREMHLHTNYTDGAPTIAEVVQRAESLGLAAIAFTEHARADSHWFPEFAAEVRRHARSTAVRVLVGAEVRIKGFDGSLDISSEIREHCDLVLASVHRFPGPDGEPLAFRDVPRAHFAETEYRLAMGLLQQGGADVLAHPGGMSLKHLRTFPTEWFASIMAASRTTNVAIEINSGYLRDVGPFLEVAEQVDPLVSVGSDAHTLEQMGRCRQILREYLWPA